MKTTRKKKRILDSDNLKDVSRVQDYKDINKFSKILLNEPDTFIEVRIFGAYESNPAWNGNASGIVYGYFDDAKELSKCVKRLERKSKKHKGVCN